MSHASTPVTSEQPTSASSDLLRRFQPSSIVVVGASPDPARFGGRAVGNILNNGYGGEVWGVNPKYNEIFGRPCFPSVEALPDSPELAILTVGTAATMPALESCAERGVKLAVVFGAGFAEVSEAGEQAQLEIKRLAVRSGMRVLGPNCLGFISSHARVAAAPAGVLEKGGMPTGPVSLVSQSGMLAFVSIFSRARDAGLGFRHVVTTGNECDLNTIDVMEAFIEDDETRVIAAYLEGIPDAERFRSVAGKAAAANKPIVLFKVGRSDAGALAAKSHTASLAGTDDVHDAVFEREGVIRVKELDDLWRLPHLMASVPKPRGRRVAIVGTSGGLNGVLADDLADHGLPLATFDQNTLERLSTALPDIATAGNPLDLTGFFAGAGREDEYGDFLKIASESPDVDLVVFAPGIDRVEFAAHADQLAKRISECTKPAVVLSIGGHVSDVGLAPVRAGGYPILSSSVECARLLERLAVWGSASARTGNAPRETQPTPLVDQLSAERFDAALEAYGIPLVRRGTARTPDEAAAAGTQVGFPVALKAIGTTLQHKSDAGGVALNLVDADSVRDEASRMQAALGDRIEYFEVQQMILGTAVEVIVGVTRDASFGPVVVVGLGGIFVELMADTVTLIPPLTVDDVHEAVGRLRGSAIFSGLRGAGAVDLDALAEVVVAVSHLASDFRDDIESLDLNPVMVSERGAVVVDWLLVERTPSEVS